MKTALSTLYVYVFILLLMSGYSQMFTLDIWPSVSAITFSITFFPFSWLLKLLLNKAACPCTTQDEEDMFDGCCGILRSEQDTPGCYCEIKGKNPSRRQNTRALFIELPFSLREPLWSSTPSRVQPHRSWFGIGVLPGFVGSTLELTLSKTKLNILGVRKGVDRGYIRASIYIILR